MNRMGPPPFSEADAALARTAYAAGMAWAAVSVGSSTRVIVGLAVVRALLAPHRDVYVVSLDDLIKGLPK